MNVPDVLLVTIEPPLTRLYVIPEIGVLTVMDDCDAQVGCIAVMTGAAGEAGAAVMVTVFDDEEVPHPLVAVTV